MNIRLRRNWAYALTEIEKSGGRGMIFKIGVAGLRSDLRKMRLL